MDPARSKADYTGGRILEVMHEAVNYTAAIAALIDRAWPKDARRVTEFGAGDGAFAKRFRSAGRNVDCVEIDERLRGDLRAAGLAVHATIGEIAEQSCDFIYSINVLEHIPNLGEELLALNRALRGGGTFFAFVPAFRMLWTSLDSEVGHVTRFTRGSLSAALREAGFELHRLAYFDSLGFPAALAVRLMERLGIFSYGGGTVKFYDRCIFPLSQAMDLALSPLVGKNLIVVARKPSVVSGKCCI